MGNNNFDPRYGSMFNQSMQTMQSPDDQYNIDRQQQFQQQPMLSQQEQFDRQNQLQQLQQIAMQYQQIQLQNQFQGFNQQQSQQFNQQQNQQYNHHQNQQFNQQPNQPFNQPNQQYEQQSRLPIKQESPLQNQPQNQISDQLQHQLKSPMKNLTSNEQEKQPGSQQQQPKPSNAVMHTIHTHLGFREIEILIKDFTPGKNKNLSAEEWINEIERLGVIHKWDSSRLLLYATMRLRGVAKTWYEYSLDGISNWEDFKRGFVSNFPKPTDTTSIHTRLKDQSRSSFETLEEYFHCTVCLAKKIKLNDVAIKDYLIRGLQEMKHQVILSSIGPCSLTDFLKHMMRLEAETAETRQSAPVRDPSPDRSASRKRSYSPKTTTPRSTRTRFDSESNTMDRRDRRMLRCSVCNSDKHTRLNCPVKAKQMHPDSTTRKEPKQRQCFICHSLDHLARNCQQGPREKRGLPSEKLKDSRSDANIDDLDEFDLDIDDEIGEQIDEVLDLAHM